MKYFLTNSRALFLFCMLAVMAANNVAAETKTSSSQIRDHRTKPSLTQGVVRDHRRFETPVSLKANQRLLLTNGVYIELLANGTLNVIEMNGRVVRPFPRGKIVKDKRGGITVISGQQRVQAGVFKAISAVKRPSSQLRLKSNQRLLLTDGNYVERLANGTVNIIIMNGRVVRPFPKGKIVKDKRGGITIISGQQRVQAGVFKSISAIKRPSSQLRLKSNQRLLLTNGNYVERLANGTVNIINMNGRVVRPFPKGKIVKDKRGGITIISGQQRVQAGVFKGIKTFRATQLSQ